MDVSCGPLQCVKRASTGWELIQPQRMITCVTYAMWSFRTLHWVFSLIWGLCFLLRRSVGVQTHCARSNMMGNRNRSALHCGRLLAVPQSE